MTLMVISILLGRCIGPSEGCLIDVLMSMEPTIRGCKSAHKTHMSHVTILVPGPRLVFPKIAINTCGGLVFMNASGIDR